jgi:hypothetical protein
MERRRPLRVLNRKTTVNQNPQQKKNRKQKGLPTMDSRIIDRTCFACLTVINHDEHLTKSEYYDDQVCRPCFIDGQDKLREEGEQQ